MRRNFCRQHCYRLSQIKRLVILRTQGALRIARSKGPVCQANAADAAADRLGQHPPRLEARYHAGVLDGAEDEVVINSYGDGAINLPSSALYLRFKPFWRAAGRAIDDRGSMNSPATFFHRQCDFWERERIAGDDRH